MLDRLPPELLLQILDVRNFRDSSSSSSTREESERRHVAALRACALVCKHTNSVARPELWREVSTFKSTPQYERLLHRCAFPRFASLAQLVRVLGFEPNSEAPSSKGPRIILGHSLPSLPNLQELHVVSHDVLTQFDKLARLDRVLVGCHEQDKDRILALEKLPRNSLCAMILVDPSCPYHRGYPTIGFALTKAAAGWRHFCFTITHLRPLEVRIEVAPKGVSCSLFHRIGAPLSSPTLIQRTVVRAKWPDGAWSPHSAQPNPRRIWMADLKLVRLDARNDPSATNACDSDAYPRVETIFLPMCLRDPPVSAPPELHAQRSQFFEQCAAQHVRVDYLCSESRPDWPEWAKGLPVLEELVDR